MTITIERGDAGTVRELILEYAESTGVDLSFQHFQEEIASLDDFYDAMWLARFDGQPAGCAALLRNDDEICEMKRLYVRRQFRGHDIGRALAERVIEEARRRKYRRMRLDTLPTMKAAQALYRSLGFVEIDAYRFNPVEGSVFMELVIPSL